MATIALDQQNNVFDGNVKVNIVIFCIFYDILTKEGWCVESFWNMLPKTRFYVFGTGFNWILGKFSRII